MKPKKHKKARTDRPTLPELDQTKKWVLNSLTSLQSRRSYQHAMGEFIEWYCSEPRLGLNRAVVLRYTLQLEAKKLAASTMNVRLAAVRRLAYEVPHTGLLSPYWSRASGVSRQCPNLAGESATGTPRSVVPPIAADATLPSRHMRAGKLKSSAGAATAVPDHSTPTESDQLQRDQPTDSAADPNSARVFNRLGM
jgi:hypothetical protein